MERTGGESPSLSLTGGPMTLSRCALIASVSSAAAGCPPKTEYVAIVKN